MAILAHELARGLDLSKKEGLKLLRGLATLAEDLNAFKYDDSETFFLDLLNAGFAAKELNQAIGSLQPAWNFCLLPDCCHMTGAATSTTMTQRQKSALRSGRGK